MLSLAYEVWRVRYFLRAISSIALGGLCVVFIPPLLVFMWYLHRLYGSSGWASVKMCKGGNDRSWMYVGLICLVGIFIAAERYIENKR